MRGWDRLTDPFVVARVSSRSCHAPAVPDHERPSLPRGDLGRSGCQRSRPSSSRTPLPASTHFPGEPESCARDRPGLRPGRSGGRGPVPTTRSRSTAATSPCPVRVSFPGNPPRAAGRCSAWRTGRPASRDACAPSMGDPGREYGDYVLGLARRLRDRRFRLQGGLGVPGPHTVYHDASRRAHGVIGGARSTARTRSLAVGGGWRSAIRKAGSSPPRVSTPPEWPRARTSARSGSPCRAAPAPAPRDGADTDAGYVAFFRGRHARRRRRHAR